MKIGVIGSGVCALTIGNFLRNTKFQLTFFEKARGVGGRLCTRRKDGFEFDHGAQFFKASHKEFIEFLENSAIKNGALRAWEADFAEISGETGEFLRAHKWKIESRNFVGSPSMSSFSKFLAKDLEIKLETKIEKIIKKDNEFFLIDQNKNEFGPYDFLILAIPPKQAYDLLNSEIFYFHKKLDEIKMNGCFSLMIGFHEKPKDFIQKFDISIVTEPSILSLISFNHSKPMRNKNQFCMVGLARNSWADLQINLNSENEIVKKDLLNEISRILNYDFSKADLIDLQKFKFANLKKKSKEDPLIDFQNKITVCGDWEFGGRVECSFLSGKRIANIFKNEFI